MFAVLIVAALVGLGSRASDAAEKGDQVVVVYNKAQADSKKVAQHYAKVRQVPERQVVGFDLPVGEVMTRADFQKKLQRPLFDYLVSKKLFTLALLEPVAEDAVLGQHVQSSSIRYLVLCYGVPLKIQNDETLAEPRAGTLPAALRNNGAAVDSELAWLPLSRQKLMLAGPMPNSQYGTTNFQSLNPTNGILMVARLDGPTPEIALGLVDKAVEADASGLWGRAYFDARNLTNGQYALGDEWIRSAAKAAQLMGFDTVVDEKPQTLPASFPLSQVALYAGWYDDNVSGPFAAASVEFMPGAFAYHLHSYSAATLRSATHHWAGPLLAKGVTATVGNVDEPYLQFTVEVGMLVFDLLHQGASFGEAAWACERVVSWQTTVVGDPLYRPFGVPLDVRHRNLELRQSRLAEWSHILVVNRNLQTGMSAEEALEYLRQVPLTAQSAVLTEKRGDIERVQQKLPEAVASFQQALERQPSPKQKVRLLQNITDLQVATGNEKAAAETLVRLLKECPDHPVTMEQWKGFQALAGKAGNKELSDRCEAEIKRLTPPPDTTNAPAGGGAAGGNTKK